MNILITGKNSNIGNCIQKWLESHDEGYKFYISQLDVSTDAWESFDFSTVDTIIHVAAIVHQPQCKDWSLYKKVNAELPFKIANKAKSYGVKHFIFISTMAVYGIGKVLCRNKISSETIPHPKDSDYYGKSKFIGETLLKPLESKDFLLTIVRPPNVYGPCGRGGYLEKFSKYLKYLPAIPVAYTNIKQSMLYIDNLTEFIRMIVIHKKAGTFMPQDEQPVSTVELLFAISRAQNRKKKLSKILGKLVVVCKFIPIVRKVYGGISYDIDISNNQDFTYRVENFQNAINITVKHFKV